MLGDMPNLPRLQDMQSLVQKSLAKVEVPPNKNGGYTFWTLQEYSSKDHHLFVASFLWSQIDTKTSFGSPFGLKCQVV